MAHEISTVEVGGQQIVEAMYANDPAWHGLGKVFEPGTKKAPNSEEAMELAHLGWRVGLEDVQLVKDGKGCVGHRAVVRQDTRHTLGMVGMRYVPFQNAEGFSFLDSLQMDGVIRYESAMALKGGEIVVLLARLPTVDTVAAGDTVLRYMMAMLTHDGSGGIVLQPTATRVVCANTLRVALSAKQGRVTIRHTGNIADKLKVARAALSQFDKGFTLYRNKAAALVARKPVGLQARDYLNTLYPIADDATARSMAMRETKVQAVKDAVMHKSNRLPAIRDSWWNLFNAVTYTVDHGARTRGTDDRTRDENRFLSSVDGAGADFKDEAFNLALEMSGAAADFPTEP